MENVTVSTSFATEGQVAVSTRPSIIYWIRPVFFLSGFSALLYQVVWQRTLFTIYGTNVESVAMIVTAFMLGLGIGSLAGGELSRVNRWPILLLFASIELCIGLFGAASLPLFQWIGRFTLHMSPLGTGIATLLLVLLPTLLMGGTLPLLVAHEVRTTANVGRSVGELYFVNTLGSAAAGFLAAIFLLKQLGQQKTIWLASGINLTVAATTLAFFFREQKRG